MKYFNSLLFTLLLFSILFFPTKIFAANFYFNGAVDGDWSNLSNWWDDAGLTIQSTVLPGVSDDVFLLSTVNFVSGPNPQVNTLSFDDGGANHTIGNIDIIVAGGASFYNTASIVSGSIIRADVVMNNTGVNNGTIIGNTTFNDSTSNYDYGVVTGNATFNGTSINEVTSTINGNATFNDTSYNKGTITGNATFNGTYYNAVAPSGGVLTVATGKLWSGDIQGLVYGSDAAQITSFIFNGTSNSTGRVPGNATFNSSSYNGGIITGDATFNNTSRNAGNILGNATINSTYYNATTPTAGVLTLATGKVWDGNIYGTVFGSDAAAITSYVFNGNAQNRGGFVGTGTFNSSSQNTGVATGTVTFNTSAANNGTVAGDAIFNNTSGNGGSPYGVVTGNATFNNTSNNATYGDVLGLATFNDTSTIIGSITGSARFNTTYYGNGIAPSAGVFTVVSSRSWVPVQGVAGTMYGSDNQVITSFNFTGTGQNLLGKINVDAAFNGSGGNSGGTINGDVIFNSTGINNSTGTINGDATFNSTSRNEGTINGDATFNTTYFGTVPAAGVFTFDGSDNYLGTITGTAYGSDSQVINNFNFTGSSVNSGTIPSNATFTGNSSNAGTVNGNADIYHPSAMPVGGTVLGTITYHGDTLYFNAAVDGDWSNLNNWWFDSSFTTPATLLPNFADDAIASATISSDSLGGASVKTFTFNNGAGGQYLDIPITVSDLATFNGTSYNNSIIAGNGTFNDSSYNNNTVQGVGTFNGDLSENLGTVGGTKIRRYTATATTTRDFVTTQPWTAVADGAGVVISVINAVYDGTTTFSELNGGDFLYEFATSTPPDPEPEASSSGPSSGSARRSTAPSTVVIPVPEPVVVVKDVIPDETQDEEPKYEIPNTPESDTDQDSESGENSNRSGSASTTVISSIEEKKPEGGVIRDFLDLVDVSRMNEAVVLSSDIITTTGISVFSLSTLLNIVSKYIPLSEPSSIPIRLWSLGLGFLGFRRKYRPWGTVYDSVTKQPLDPAFVTLFDDSGKEVTSSITDIDGRYGFLLGFGSYTITAAKSNYTFPSKKLAGKTEDELYSGLYFGEPFTVDDNNQLAIKNIPMDQENFDWNEFAKNQKKLTLFYSKRDLLIQRTINTLFYLGLCSSIFSLLSNYSVLNLAVFLFYVFMMILKYLGVTSRAFGIVKDSESGSPLSFAIVTIFSEILNDKIMQKVADKNGKYYCIVPPGDYHITIQVKNSNGGYDLAYTSDVFHSRTGVINTDFAI